LVAALGDGRLFGAAVVTSPLQGYRVLDLTQVVMGPVATQILAEYGADVIKVEPPTGDTSRHIPPMRNAGMGYIYLLANRGKRSVVLDLKQPAGIDALLALVATADVIVCNVRAEAMARLGLTYERFRAANPAIVYVNLIGFGEGGPYAGDPAYEDLIQSLTAVPSLLMRAGADEPMFVPLAFNDRACGQTCATAVLAALLGRTKTGKGTHVTIPMFETMAAAVLADHLGGRTFDPPIGPMGYQRILTDLRRPYRTQDGYVSMVLYTDKHWRAFCAIAGDEHWFASDPRLASITQRTHHARDIYPRVVEIMLTRPSADWVTLLKDADVPVAVVHTLETLIEDPQLAASGMMAMTRHATEGELLSITSPTRWSGEKPLPLGDPPQLGEHTAEILREAGLDDGAIATVLAQAR
jgi:crotonobetainyl-CoA:carnitine CoA-transferase CaiB-like acyl-CoA transferase